MKKSSSKTTKGTKTTNVLDILQSKEFGQVKVVSGEKAEGFVCLDDFCDILELSKKEAMGMVGGHLFTVVVHDTKGKEHKMDFVDEIGVYLLFILCKKEDAIRVQEWLEESFLKPLREKRKLNVGIGKDVILVAEPNHQCQTLRYMATAHNVARSGHFKVGKDVPGLTMDHLRGWWYNLSDKRAFMLQFNCKTEFYVFQNIRMNIYLTKQEDGNTEACDMRISVLDLDDDNWELFSIDTWLPSYAVIDNTILDYILEELTMDEDILDPKNADLVILLNGVMSFYRSRRV